MTFLYCVCKHFIWGDVSKAGTGNLNWNWQGTFSEGSNRWIDTKIYFWVCTESTHRMWITVSLLISSPWPPPGGGGWSFWRHAGIIHGTCMIRVAPHPSSPFWRGGFWWFLSRSTGDPDSQRLTPEIYSLLSVRLLLLLQLNYDKRSRRNRLSPNWLLTMKGRELRESRYTSNGMHSSRNHLKRCSDLWFSPCPHSACHATLPRPRRATKGWANGFQSKYKLVHPEIGSANNTMKTRLQIEEENQTEVTLQKAPVPDSRVSLMLLWDVHKVCTHCCRTSPIRRSCNLNTILSCS